ncbi:hypothetical protein EVAR_13568_1 [Eumeta japonica]|uniref:Uncharacterized protein n=1 Tax=Eumeta variegata TaxID=151549 RepID=A0A4C1U9P1_EUMVA|nr:hypothetical protein EVAR_13568_1 [Eumeta japonica]
MPILMAYGTANSNAKKREESMKSAFPTNAFGMRFVSRSTLQWVVQNNETRGLGRTAQSIGSPDLTPLDFYVWGRQKVVYATEVQNVEDLRERMKRLSRKFSKKCF